MWGNRVKLCVDKSDNMIVSSVLIKVEIVVILIVLISVGK